jgi:hypothetical protein
VNKEVAVIIPLSFAMANKDSDEWKAYLALKEQAALIGFNYVEVVGDFVYIKKNLNTTERST